MVIVNRSQQNEHLVLLMMMMMMINYCVDVSGKIPEKMLLKNNEENEPSKKIHKPVAEKSKEYLKQERC